MKNLYFFITLAFVCLLSACSTIEEPKANNEKSEYLDFPEGISLANLSKEGIKVLQHASKRVVISEDENGLLVLETNDPQEINVSNEVFQYFIEVVNNTNSERLENDYIARPQIISRSEGGATQGFTGTMDCLAWAIGAASSRTTYHEVANYLLQNYNGAPPFKDAFKILSKYGDVREINLVEPGALLGNEFIIIYKTGEHSCHAVNGLYVSDGYDSNNHYTVHVVDYQSANIETGDKPTYRTVNSSAILAIYKYY